MAMSRGKDEMSGTVEDYGRHEDEKSLKKCASGNIRLMEPKA